MLFIVCLLCADQWCVSDWKKEELDEKKVQMAPPGFHIIFLPLAQDFREIKMGQHLSRGLDINYKAVIDKRLT